MKKLLFILVLFAASLTASAQNNFDSTALVTYQIDVSGSSDLLQIPDTFYISITGFNLERDGGYYYIVTSQTYMDSENVRNIRNDDFLSGAKFPVTKSQLATYTPIQIFTNTVKERLNDVYGASNVTKLP